MPRVHDVHAWPRTASALRAAAPEAFADDGAPLNLIGGVWGSPGNARTVLSPVDSSPIGRLPMLDVADAARAVELAADAREAWVRVPVDERVRRVRLWLDDMRAARQTLTLSLCWELGKSFSSAASSVDRTIGGVEWYCDQIGAMLTDGGRREPLGLVSNIASWNYPLSVLVHACIVQTLAGNTVIAKTPTDGGTMAITLSMALAARRGLPVSLVSGSGGRLSEALVAHPRVDCFAFVGGKAIGRDIAARMLRPGLRHMLEMEGVNAYGVWEFGDWPALAAQLRKGFEFGKQRCTAYARFVVQRELFPEFLEMYTGVLRSLKIGNPLAGDDAGHTAEPPLPAVDFGPLINERKVEELHDHITEAVHAGGLELYRGKLDEALFVPGQDRSAYMAPTLLSGVPRRSFLYYNEPFGPVDTAVVVDTLDQLIDEMNVSNGNLVASVATGNEAVAARVRAESRAFKFGVNQARSRGDKDEPFGGKGQSWRGCFVGGKHLVRAVTRGPAGERLAGNFAEYSQMPD